MTLANFNTSSPIAEKERPDKSNARGIVVSLKKSGFVKCRECSVRPFCIASKTNDKGMQAFNEISNHPAPTQKGDYFYHQGDTFTSLYRVRSGAVKSYHIDKNGQEHIIGFHLPGELFGTDGMANGQHQNFAQALDTSTVCEMNYEQLGSLLKKSPDLQQKMFQILSAECIQKIEPLLFLHHRPVEERLITFIADISSRYKSRGLSPKRFILPMSRRDIAHHLGTTEETISRLFSRIQRMGILLVEKRTIIIKDMEKLQASSMAL